MDLDSEAYKDRNTFERPFSLFKHMAGVATRYDKLALTYRTGVVLYAVVMWLGQYA